MKIVETDRLVIRKLNENDFDNLAKILQDKDVMYAYEHAFSDNEVQEWLDRQLLRYRNDGIGLYAVELKSNGEFIGQCGLTMQDYRDKRVVEIGYLFRKDYWHNGYATESAIAMKKYAFDVLNINEVYSIIRDNNIASQNVAIRNGMQKIDTIVKHYYNIDMPHYVYVIKKNSL